MEDDRDKRRVEERWGDAEGTAALRDMYWTASSVVSDYINRRTTGLSDCSWLAWLHAFVLTPPGRELDCLVLGCGEGWLERALAPLPLIRSILAADLSPQAVAEAERHAREAGLDGVITYRVANLDRDPLPKKAFDVVIAHSVLHHVNRLEFVYEQIEASLRRGGLLVINEYVGPRHLQISDDQVQRINAIMDALPASLRRSALTGEVLEERRCPPLEDVLKTDPSEAIRSDEVLALAKERFELFFRSDYGGSLLQPLLYELVPNFDDSDPEHGAILGLICLLEERLIDGGVLPSDFVFCLAKKRGDRSFAFQVPAEAPGDPHLPPSPWFPVSPLPEVGGLDLVNEHFGLRVSGRKGCDALDWCLEQVTEASGRETGSCHCLALGPVDFSPVLGGRFGRLDVGGGRERSAYHALFSLGALTVDDLADRKQVRILHRRLKRRGVAVILAPTRNHAQAPTDAVRTTVRGVIATLPRHLRPTGLDANPPPESDVFEVPDLDAVRSALRRRFHILHFRPLGWALLQVLMPELSGLVDVSREGDAAILRLLCLLDQQLVDDGVLPTDFVLAVVQKR